MPYVPPEDVTSPQDVWKLTEVLYDSGEDGWSAARGLWDGEPAIGIRWNRTIRGSEVGHPQARGYATWFIVPKELRGVVGAVLELIRNR